MSSLRDRRGQASPEYLAIVLLVITVLGGAAALTFGGLGTEIAYGVRRGICAVAGTPCPARPRAVADLPPCPTGRSAKAEDFSVSVAFLRLAGGLGVLEERTSDGRVTVTFSDTGAAGLTAGVGAHFSLGKARVGAEAGGDIGVTFSAGRSWDFASQTLADAFVKHYGSDQTMAGRLGNDARRACLACKLIGWQPDKPPVPDAVFVEGGGAGGLEATVGAGYHAGLRATLGQTLGHRTGPAGTTWYVRLDTGGAARLLAGVGRGATGGASALAELGSDRAGHLRSLVVRVARHGSVQSAPLRRAGSGVGPEFRGSGGLTETEATLDLTEPGNRDAALALLGGEGSAPLARKLRERGVWTRRSYRLRDTHDGVDGAVGVGPVAGGGFGRDSQRLELTGVSTRLPGLAFLPRADCLAQ